MPSPSHQVTALLLEWGTGRDGAFDDLVPLVYDELRRLALRGEAKGHTLHTTALVHEAYLKLVGADVGWEDSGHFMRVRSCRRWGGSKRPRRR